MSKFNFRDFDFTGFKDFIFEIVDKYDFFGIRFFPRNKPELFSDYQLTHAAPGRDISNSGGFIWAWKQNKDSVRVVNFVFKTRDRKSQIKMVINLNKKTIIIEKVDGFVSLSQIEKALIDSMDIISSKGFCLPDFIKDNLIKVIIGVLIAVLSTFLLGL
jgi:hypothetical protein